MFELPAGIVQYMRQKDVFDIRDKAVSVKPPPKKKTAILTAVCVLNVSHQDDRE